MDCTELETGSHIKTKRMFYEHHGIYIGEGLVIHYAFDGIRVDTMEKFSRGEPVKKVPHSDSPYTGDEIRERAFSRLGEEEYDLVLNNCEHFANWCCMGEEESEQVEDVVGLIGELLKLVEELKRMNQGIEEERQNDIGSIYKSGYEQHKSKVRGGI